MSMIFFEIEFLRILISIIMLITASVLDLWKRQIHDIFWIPFAAIAIVFLFVENNLIDNLITSGFSLIIAPIVLVMWRLGLFGGADVIGLIVLQALAPLVTLGDNIVTPFTVISNAALFSVAIFLVNIIRNCVSLLNHQDIFYGFDESKKRKIIAMFIGFRAKNPKFSFSIEEKSGKAKKFSFSLHHAEKTEFCNKNDTWVSAGMPFILFITVGFITQIFFGDIILESINSIFL